MGHPVGPASGGEPYDRAPRGASAQIGGEPSARSEVRPFSEPIELDSPESRRIEQKLRAEALARRNAEDDDAVIDPSGHA